MSGFDCEDIYQEHCFLVRIPKASDGDVEFLEVFGRPPGDRESEWAPECALRAVLSRDKWEVVANDARMELNRTLKAEGKKSGRWQSGNNGVQRLLGKELLTLIWGIEDDRVADDTIPVAIRNWLGLKREERWWLYTMTAATTGYASQRGKGWRSALRDALTFEPHRDGGDLGLLAERQSLKPKANPNMHKPTKTGSGRPDDGNGKLDLAGLTAF